jgi:CMP-N-acetylneuraminic acid synthetase
MNMKKSSLKPNIVALLPMKANSVRVKGKNFRNFLNKPLFQWILDTLLSINEIDLIVINTDAREILLQNGLIESTRIIIRDRKLDLKGDNISMNLILLDDINAIPSNLYVMTHTTNPLLGAKTIKDALNAFKEKLDNKEADSLFSVDKEQSRFYRNDCSPVNHDPRNLIPTQDLEPWFKENSNLYIFSEESFRHTNSRIGNTPMLFEIPKIESIDIDNENDWDLALAVASYLIRK